MKKTLLVIGGSGFFGKSILDAFQRRMLDPWDIGEVAIIARQSRHLLDEAPRLISPQVSLHQLDIGTCTDLPPADYVIHAAASADAANYLSRPQEERRNILSATDNYARLAPSFHRHSKIVYTSSGAVYGVQPPELDALPENFEPGPSTLMDRSKQDYAVAKRDSEQLIRVLGSSGLNVSLARCFAFVGEFLPRDKHFAIGNFISDGLHGRKIQIKAHHAVYRSYMHADDLVRWLMTLAEHASPACPCYNVGSDHAVGLDDLARQIATYFSVEADIPARTESRIDRYVPSIARARADLDLDLQYDLPTAIDATVHAIRQRAQDMRK